MNRFTHSPARTHHTFRRGITLLELLVVIAILLGLSALVIMFASQAMNRDRSAEAVNRVVGGMQISKAMARRDGSPRGIRLISVATANGPQAIAFQFIASPPVLVPNYDGLPPYTDPVNGAAFVQLDYAVGSGVGAPMGIVNRQCVIHKLTDDQVAQINAAIPAPGQPVLAYPLLYLPTLGAYHRIVAVTATAGDGTRLAGGLPLFQMTVTLDGYPDFALGGATSLATHYFGIYRPPVPLLGQETVPLPENTCVDLAVSYPNGVGGVDYDILFGPGGQLITTASTGGVGQAFLWVRDPNKEPTMGVYPGTPPSLTALQRGGEQLIIGIKAKGGVSVAPVDWDWTSGGDPFSLARQAVAN